MNLDEFIEKCEERFEDRGLVTDENFLLLAKEIKELKDWKENLGQ